MVFESVKASIEASSPTKNSSMTTRSPASLKTRSTMTSLRARLALSRSMHTMAPLPAASPSALMTMGTPAFSRYATALAWSVNTSYPAVGMRYRFIRSLENALEPSIIAALALGPNALRPADSNLSTMPATKGASGPTTVRSTALSLANSRSPRMSSAATGTHSASWAIPALPGAQYIFLTFLLWDSFQTRACSRPPEPMTSMFTISTCPLNVRVHFSCVFGK